MDPDTGGRRRGLAGAPSWGLSTGFHTILLVLLSLLVVASVRVEAPAAVAADLSREAPPLPPIVDAIPRSDLPPRTEFRPAEVSVPVPKPDAAPAEVVLPDRFPDVPEPPAEGPPAELALLEPGGPGLGGTTAGESGAEAGYGLIGLGTPVLPGRGHRGPGRTGAGPGLWGLRGDGFGKAQALRDRGGNVPTEWAVLKALEWLSSHQEPDGRWDCQKHEGMTKPRENVKTPMSYDVAVTGLAVLAFLGAGHTTASPKYGKNVRDALYWLEEKQGANGKWPGSHYGQGIAALAMAEAYGMGCGHAECAQKAMDYLKHSQNPDGGWNYGTGEAPPDEKGPLHGRGRSDTSVTGWQVMAAKSGKIAGLKVDPTIFTGAQKYFGMVGANEYEGGSEAQIFYSHANGRRAVNAHEGGSAIKAITMLSLLFMGDGGQGPWMQKAAGDLRATGVTLDNFYYVYYGSLAMFQIGGGHWKAWNEQMRDPMIRLQRVGGDADGSWDPDTKHGPYGGRVYQTALGAMILEVYYRYLPVLNP